ncbi:hypothetical protein JCM8097_002940 [Rhodosporidiobolus ruineniae]
MQQPYSDHDGLLNPSDGSPAVGLVSPLVGQPSSSQQHSRASSPQPHLQHSQGNYYPHFDHPPPPHDSNSQPLPLPLPLPRINTPEPRSAALAASAAGPSSLKVLQWTPQRGVEGTQVTIILDAAAVRNPKPSPYSSAPAYFGPGSPNLGGSPQKNGAGAPNRSFSVLFGAASARTSFTRAQQIDGNGVGQSMLAGPTEEDAFVVLSTVVPSRGAMGPLGDRVHVVVQVLDETGSVTDSTFVGEWDPQSPATPTRVNALKRAGDDLFNDREAPGTRSPASRSVHNSPVRPQGEWASPSLSHHTTQSPALGHSIASSASHVYGDADGGADVVAPLPPLNTAGGRQPELIRTSQIHAPKNGYGATYSHKVVLKLQGDLNTMAMGWSNEEWTSRRRLIQFWPQQDGNVINVNFRPIAQHEYVQNAIVISCIFRDEWNECFVTSVDTIYLLEALVGSRFTVEEKNRIRRNLEGFKPMTVSKSKPDAEPFFKLIMSFPNPKPRNIEKDVKVFPWKILAQALKKIMSKYSANYPLGPDGAPLAGSAPPADPLSASHTPLQQHDSRFQPLSPHLGGGSSGSPHLGHSSGSPHLGHSSVQPSPNLVHASPHLGHAQAHVHQSPHLHHASPHIGQSPHLGHAAPAHFPSHLDRSPLPDMHRSPALGGGGGGGGGYANQFGDSLDPYGNGGGGHYGHQSYAAPPPPPLPHLHQPQHPNLFPSAEDYGVPHSATSSSSGVGGDRLLPPVSVGGGANGGGGGGGGGGPSPTHHHLRSFSEGQHYGGSSAPGSAYASPIVSQHGPGRWDGPSLPPPPMPNGGEGDGGEGVGEA